jgi:predicted MFS family arabinose efflux permease
LTRRDAVLYVWASGVGNFGLGVAAFYLNFVYRALGFDDLQIGAAVGALAVGSVLAALPADRLARGRSRRAVILVGGFVTAAGLIGILAFDAFPAVLVASALLGAGGLTVSASGAALLADATASAERAVLFGRQIALGTVAGFLSSFIAGLLAAPVSAALGRPAGDLLVLRVLVAAGGIIAASSALPILFVSREPVPPHPAEAPPRRALLLRFVAINLFFGFGAGSFLPFVNLFFADRYGVAFGALGAILGAIAVAGSLGALLHPYLEPRAGALRAVVVVQALSLPFALVAAFTGDLAVAVVALSVRAALMYGSASTFAAYQLSSFAPAERAGAQAVTTIAWNATSALGSFTAGAARQAAGPEGFTLNLVTLVAAYLVAIVLTVALFRGHRPSGDVAPIAMADQTPVR